MQLIACGSLLASVSGLATLPPKQFAQQQQQQQRHSGAPDRPPQRGSSILQMAASVQMRPANKRPHLQQQQRKESASPRLPRGEELNSQTGPDPDFPYFSVFGMDHLQLSAKVQVFEKLGRRSLLSHGQVCPSHCSARLEGFKLHISSLHHVHVVVVSTCSSP